MLKFFSFFFALLEKSAYFALEKKTKLKHFYYGTQST
nr:MAG TPA: hypothetical protein [Caudoviricetes sp.]